MLYTMYYIYIFCTIYIYIYCIICHVIDIMYDRLSGFAQFQVLRALDGASAFEVRELYLLRSRPKYREANSDEFSVTGPVDLLILYYTIISIL